MWKFVGCVRKQVIKSVGINHRTEWSQLGRVNPFMCCNGLDNRDGWA
jgi:hypothetical protein